MSGVERKVAEPVAERGADDLLAQLDRLAQRLEATVGVVEQLRRERQSLLAGAGAGNAGALAKRIERWRRLEEEHRILLAERREAAERLQGLIDKVDRLQR